MRVRLTRKLADCIDGVDLRHHTVGEVIYLPPKDATLLIAEKWAVLARRRPHRSDDAVRPLRRERP
jgi:hypothetical protein